jgi:hypothetical protein
MRGENEVNDQLRSWTYRRQLLGRSGGSALEALRRVIGVYSSHPTAPLSLACRSASISAEEFTSLEQNRQAIRVPGMRGSNFLVPIEMAPRVFAATLLPMEKHARRFQIAGISMEEYEALKPRLLDAAQEPVSAKDLQERVPVEGKLPTIARIMCVEGLMLRIGGGLRSDNLRYVSTEAWLGHPLEAADPEASLSWLAEAYLRAFGPARITDVAWWIGIPMGRAKAALANADLADLGEGLLLPVDLVDDFSRVEPIDPETIDLLPKWDVYTMGLAGDGRQRFLNDEHRALAYTTKASGGGPPGDGFPLVLQGGRAIASWSHRFTGDKMQVTISPFEPGPLPNALNEGSFAGIGSLLGAKKIELLG